LVARARAIKVHPRACGEQSCRYPWGSPGCGSSPRVRGTGGRALLGVAGWRFIPARAGNSLPPPPSVQDAPVHPRACGEQVVSPTLHFQWPGSSPRVRGTVMVNFSHPYSQRFIPARAGNSRVSLLARPFFAVHPRACGEQRKMPSMARF